MAAAAPSARIGRRFLAGLLFTDWTAAGHLLAERWGEFLRARVKRLERIVLERPGDIGRVLDRLFDSATASAGGVWIEAMGVDPPGVENGPWKKARRALLARLNERRERLRRQLMGGVLIALPAVGKVEARDEAPDLWTIRSLVLEPRRSAAEERKAEEGKQERGKAKEQVGEEARGDTGAPVELDPETAELLRTAYGHLNAGRAGSAVAAALEAARRLEGVSAVGRGWAIAIAAQARFDEDDWPAAADLFEQALAAVPLENPSWAQIAWAHHACTAAERFDLRRSLENALLSVKLARQLATASPDSREALDALCAGLSWVGGLQARLGDLESASSAFQESLELRRRLLAGFGETRMGLQALSLCLEAIGKLKEQSGELEAALAAYLESLVLRRRILSDFGETPESIRDLSTILVRLGDVRMEFGDLNGALACYVESRGLRRSLLADFGETVESLDDLDSVLTRIDALPVTAGYGGAAEALRRELAEVRARRAELFPAPAEKAP